MHTMVHEGGGVSTMDPEEEDLYQLELGLVEGDRLRTTVDPVGVDLWKVILDLVGVGLWKVILDPVGEDQWKATLDPEGEGV